MQRALRIAGIAGFFLLLSLPMLVQAVGQFRGLDAPDGAWENRVLAPPPHWQGSPAAFSRATDAWLDDHFGLRRPLVELANRLRFDLFAQSGNPQIAFGRHGQLFLTSHDAADPQQMLFFLCRGAGGLAGERFLAAQLAGFLDAALRRNPHVVELLVPTKTIIEAHDLPGWMRARCAAGNPVLPGLLSALQASRPDLRADVVYPLQLMRSLHGLQTPYPKFNFHWDGAALGTIAASIAEQHFHRPRLASLALHTVQKQSDVAHLLPGVRMEFSILEPDLAAAAVQAGVRIPQLGAAGPILADISRFERGDRARPEPRLLIISDSFGQAIAPWFSAYYGEVWHVSINNLAQLGADDRRRLVDILFKGYRPDDVLFVFHDFSQGFINQELMHLLWETPGP